MPIQIRWYERSIRTRSKTSFRPEKIGERGMIVTVIPSSELVRPAFPDLKNAVVTADPPPRAKRGFNHQFGQVW